MTTLSNYALAILATFAALPTAALADAVTTGTDTASAVEAATDAAAPVFYNVYAGMNLTDAQGEQLVAASQQIGRRLGQIMQEAIVETGPRYGMQMVMLNPGPESDLIYPKISEVMSGYDQAGMSITEQVPLLTAQFGQYAAFMYGSAITFSDTEKAEQFALQKEWRALAFAGLTADQLAVFDSNQKIVNDMVGDDWQMSIQIYFGSFGEPLIAPSE